MKNSSEISNGVNNQAFSKIGILPIASFLIFIIVAGGIFLYLKHWLGIEEIPEVKQSKQPEIKPPEETLINWQVFQKKNYGFSIRIPSDYSQTRGIETSAKFENNNGETLLFLFQAETRPIDIIIEADREWNEKLKSGYSQLIQKSEALKGKKLNNEEGKTNEEFLFNVPGEEEPQPFPLTPGIEFISAKKMEKENCLLFFTTVTRQKEGIYMKEVDVFPYYNDAWKFNGIFQYKKENNSLIDEIISTIECQPI